MIDFEKIKIKRLHVQLNDKIISPRQGFLLRRAPGHCFFDFVQEIVFAHAKTIIPEKQKQAAAAAANLHNADSDISMPNGCKSPPILIFH